MLRRSILQRLSAPPARFAADDVQLQAPELQLINEDTKLAFDLEQNKIIFNGNGLSGSVCPGVPSPAYLRNRHIRPLDHDTHLGL